MAWYRCGMNGTYNATTVSRSGAVCNYVANVGGVPLPRFIANITPIQEGSGDPSPSNPRPISGWSAVHAYRSGADTTNPDTYTINLGGTYYGGTLNVGTGVLTVTHGIVDLGTLEWQYSATYKWFNPTNASFPAANVKSVPNNVVADIKCTIYEPTTRNDIANDLTLNEKCCVNNGGYFIVRDLDYDDTNLFKSAMNGVKLVYELATPQTVQLTPAQVTQLLGENNVWCDSGDSEVDFFKIIRT